MDLKTRMRKWVVLRALDLVSLLAPAFHPDLQLDKVDENLKWWNALLIGMKEMETCPVMKRRWDLFRRVSLWLLSDDGAYRIRWLVLMLAIIGSAGEIKLKSYEVDDVLRFISHPEQST
jgi:hypothetical protein